MKKMIFTLIFILGLSSVNAQDLMVVNNTLAPMNGSIRLHNKYNDPNPELGDIPLAIPAYGQIWINNGPGFPNNIPFIALSNPAMSFYTPTLGANFSPGMGTSYSQTVLQWYTCCSAGFKWSCIKTDIAGYFDLDPTYPNGYPVGYIQITPPYNPSMGGYVATSWPGYVALTSTNEVFENGYGYAYNPSYALNGTGTSLHIISGTSPFGGYMVMATVY